MGTKIRPELSEKNKYWIERHRYYELKHFCLQYPIWKKAYSTLHGMSERSFEHAVLQDPHTVCDPTEKCAEAMIFYSDRIHMVDTAAIETCPELSNYLLRGITEGISYDCLRARYNVPCCKEVYYEMYRKFFWILSKIRN